MRKLHKKISMLALASMVMFGGFVSSGINSFAIYSERSIVGRPVFNPNRFIGHSEQFRKVFFKIIDESISNEAVKDYEEIIKEIDEKFKRIGLFYVGLPEEMEKYLKHNGYSFDHLRWYPKSLRSAINSILYDRSLHGKNRIVKFKHNGKPYSFIFFIDK